MEDAQDLRGGIADLFGIPVQKVTMQQVLQRVHEAIGARERMSIGVVNAAKIINMHKDPELSEAVLSSDEIYADGMSVVWASIILGERLPERVAGIDLMYGLLRQGDQHGYRIYCLGASEKVINEVCATFKHDYPRIRIVGSHHGYFDEQDEERVAREIKDSAPDILLVAISSPKKENFMSRWSGVMNVPVVHGVGGSFDVVAGLVKRAPSAWQKAGFEWLYRVLQEPRRLWRRYLITNVQFAGLLLRERVRTIAAPRSKTDS